MYKAMIIIKIALVVVVIALIVLDAVLIASKREKPKQKKMYGPEPPIHVNCRCTFIPLKPYADYKSRKPRSKRRPKGQTGRKHPKNQQKRGC